MLVSFNLSPNQIWKQNNGTEQNPVGVGKEEAAVSGAQEGHQEDSCGHTASPSPTANHSLHPEPWCSKSVPNPYFSHYPRQPCDNGIKPFPLFFLEDQ